MWRERDKHYNICFASKYPIYLSLLVSRATTAILLVVTGDMLVSFLLRLQSSPAVAFCLDLNHKKPSPLFSSTSPNCSLSKFHPFPMGHRLVFQPGVSLGNPLNLPTVCSFLSFHPPLCKHHSVRLLFLRISSSLPFSAFCL